jgi:hypothetical protein
VELNERKMETWINPLEARLPIAPDMRIYCLYSLDSASGLYLLPIDMGWGNRQSEVIGKLLVPSPLTYGRYTEDSVEEATLGDIVDDISCDCENKTNLNEPDNVASRVRRVVVPTHCIGASVCLY